MPPPGRSSTSTGKATAEISGRRSGGRHGPERDSPRPAPLRPSAQGATGLLTDDLHPIAAGILAHALEIAVAARAGLADDRIALRTQPLGQGEHLLAAPTAESKVAEPRAAMSRRRISSSRQPSSKRRK